MYLCKQDLLSVIRQILCPYKLNHRFLTITSFILKNTEILIIINCLEMYEGLSKSNPKYIIIQKTLPPYFNLLGVEFKKYSRETAPAM